MSDTGMTQQRRYEALNLKPGQIVRVRWRHHLLFGRDPLLLEGYGIVNRNGGVVAYSGRYEQTLWEQHYGIDWEAIPVDAKWEWPEEAKSR